MWPWEHLALAYLCYALYTRGRLGRPPGDRDTLALAVGTQFPDLVDKLLGWGLGALSDGVFAHSLFVAVPVVLVVVALAARADQVAVGWAFGFGYLSHLPEDAVYAVVFGKEPNFTFMFWPLVGQRSAARTGLLENFTYYFTRYQEFILSSEGLLSLGLELALVGGAVAVWIADGAPGSGLIRRRGGTD